MPLLNRLKSSLKKTALATLLPSSFYYKEKGYCYCCDKQVEFVAQNPWLRDHFLCTHCGCLPRERALMYVIDHHYPHWRDLHIHESSPIKRGASLRLKKECKQYEASHYFANHPKGTQVEGFRNEDLENLTYEDERFDLVITQDVFEHLYHPYKAFAEIARTLKKGGAHIFTVPLVNKHEPSVLWAEPQPDGKPRFLFTPEWHHNPLDPEGSAVTMHWGYDIVAHIQGAAPQLKTTLIHLDQPQLGIRAELIEVIVSVKSE